MPLLTNCSACATKVKVKDELVGKSIKCPKCGKVFKALAGEEGENAVKASALASTNGAVTSKPAAKKPPPPAWGADEDEEPAKKPAWDKKSKDDDDDDEDEDEPKAKKKPAKKGPPPKKRVDDDDDDEDEDEKDNESQAFEELLEQTTLNEIAKKQIIGELSLREKGIWVGQPDPKVMTVRGIPKAFAGAFVLAFFAIFGSVVGGSQLPAGVNVIAIAAIWVVWLILAVIITALILFMERKKALGSAYVITNKRCITFLQGWFGGPRATSYQPNLVQHMRRMPSWIFGDGAGDIVFRSVTTVTTTYHQRGGASTSVQTTYYGFLGIRNIDDVEGRIRQALFADEDDDDDDDDEDDRRRRKKKKKKKKRRDDDDD